MTTETKLQLPHQGLLVEEGLPKIHGYAAMLVRGLPSDTCTPCNGNRVKLIREMAPLWSVRLDISDALSLIEEKVPCSHLSDNSDIAARVAALIATPALVTIELP